MSCPTPVLRGCRERRGCGVATVAAPSRGPTRRPRAAWSRSGTVGSWAAPSPDMVPCAHTSLAPSGGWTWCHGLLGRTTALVCLCLVGGHGAMRAHFHSRCASVSAPPPSLSCCTGSISRGHPLSGCAASTSRLALVSGLGAMHHSAHSRCASFPDPHPLPVLLYKDHWCRPSIRDAFHRTP